MKVILKESIENVGKRGDVVNVAAGFGRNYLIPKKLALEVTPSNMKMIEIEQQALQKKLEKEVSTYRDLIEQINQTTLTFKRKTGEKDTLFGSVSPQDIKDALDELGIAVEKKKVLLSEPIKKLGDYTVSIKIFQDEQAQVKVEVLDEEGKKVRLIRKKQLQNPKK
jgi:large subunit ribosomal protein L9